MVGQKYIGGLGTGLVGCGNSGLTIPKRRKGTEEFIGKPVSDRTVAFMAGVGYEGRQGVHRAV